VCSFINAILAVTNTSSSLEVIETYVPPSSVDLHERILATRRQKELAVQDMPVKLQTLTAKYVERINQEQAYYTRATEDIKNGAGPTLLETTSLRLKKVRVANESQYEADLHLKDNR
jgi:hypothetical protein